MQTKKGSAAEAVANTIGVIFTLISLARSYVLRRWLNGLKFGNTTTTTSRERPVYEDVH